MRLDELLSKEADSITPPALFGPGLRELARPRRQWRWYLAPVLAVSLLLVFVLVRHGERRSALLDGPEVQPILSAADRAAKANLGEAVHVEAVRAKRPEVEKLLGFASNEDRDQLLWLVQIRGDHYQCQYCKGPAGAKPIEGGYIRITLTDGTWTSGTFNLGRNPLDLASIGVVETIR